MIFDRKKICDPMYVVKLICNWISDWSILQIKEPEGRMLMLGAKVLEQVASEVYRSAQGWRLGVPRLGGP